MQTVGGSMGGILNISVEEATSILLVMLQLDAIKEKGNEGGLFIAGNDRYTFH